MSVGEQEVPIAEARQMLEPYTELLFGIGSLVTGRLAETPDIDKYDQPLELKLRVGHDAIVGATDGAESHRLWALVCTPKLSRAMARVDIRTGPGFDQGTIKYQLIQVEELKSHLEEEHDYGLSGEFPAEWFIEEPAGNDSLKVTSNDPPTFEGRIEETSAGQWVARAIAGVAYDHHDKVSKEKIFEIVEKSRYFSASHKIVKKCDEDKTVYDGTHIELISPDLEILVNDVRIDGIKSPSAAFYVVEHRTPPIQRAYNYDGRTGPYRSRALQGKIRESNTHIGASIKTATASKLDVIRRKLEEVYFEVPAGQLDDWDPSELLY